MDDKSIENAIASGAARAVVSKIIETIIEAFKRRRETRARHPVPTIPRPPTAQRRLRGIYRSTYLDR